MNHPVTCEFKSRITLFGGTDYSVEVTASIDEMFSTLINIPVNRTTVLELVGIGLLQVGPKEITFTDKKFTFSLTEGLKPIE